MPFLAHARKLAEQEEHTTSASPIRAIVTLQRRSGPRSLVLGGENRGRQERGCVVRGRMRLEVSRRVVQLVRWGRAVSEVGGRGPG